MKYSIIVTTNRNYEALESLFVTTHDESELIVVDTNYCAETKNFLKRQEGYEKIVYAQPRNVLKTRRDFSQCLNCALGYAENHWVVLADDSLEFKPDFFEVADRTINEFRKTLNSDRFVVCGQKIWGSLGQERWKEYRSFAGIDKQYIEIPDPEWTFSFGLVPLEAYYALNGYDIKYDFGGWGSEDKNFLARLMRLKYLPILDRHLMAYSGDHSDGAEQIEWNKIFWELDKYEIANGKVKAFNPYDFGAMRNECLSEKNNWIV